MEDLPINQALKIAAVVVTYDRVNELKMTIAAISEQGIEVEDIIVVNNSSCIDTRRFLDRHYPTIKSIDFPENIASAGGFAEGMRIGFEKGYDWLWLFNDDSRPTPGALSSVWNFIKGDTGNIGLLKICHQNRDGKAVLLYWKGVRKPVYVDPSNDVVPTDLVTFDGCFVSRALIDRIGYCDPLYFMGTYEFDYCLKASRAGFKIFSLPNGLIEDEKLGSEKGTPPWRQYYNTRNHLWLALNAKSFRILQGWMIRELKYVYAIIRCGDRKQERLIYKYRAICDALYNRRGKRYGPDN